MLAKLDQLSNRLEEVGELLMHEDATASMDNYRKLTREHAEIGPLVALYQSYTKAEQDAAAAQDMLSDPEMKEFAQEEIVEEQEIDRLELFPIRAELPKLTGFREVFDELMRFAIEHRVAALHGEQRQRFGAVTFPGSRRTDQQ